MDGQQQHLQLLRAKYSSSITCQASVIREALTKVGEARAEELRIRMHMILVLVQVQMNM
jgi:hypothetical protein